MSEEQEQKSQASRMLLAHIGGLTTPMLGGSLYDALTTDVITDDKQWEAFRRQIARTPASASWLRIFRAAGKGKVPPPACRNG
jgi:hypothetical protein